MRITSDGKEVDIPEKYALPHDGKNQSEFHINLMNSMTSKPMHTHLYYIM